MLRASIGRRPSWPRQLRAAALLPAALLIALVAAACTASEGDAPADEAPRAAVPATGTVALAPADAPAATGAPDLGFPTGPAVLVEVGYEPPEDRVASTGALLPANGKPTLVFVDAIW